MNQFKGEIQTVADIVESSDEKILKNQRLRDVIETVRLSSLCIIHYQYPQNGIILKKIRQSDISTLDLHESFYVLDFFFRGGNHWGSTYTEIFEKIYAHIIFLSQNITLGMIDTIIELYFRNNRLRRDSNIFIELFQNCPYSPSQLGEHYEIFCNKNNWSESDKTSLFREINMRK